MQMAASNALVAACTIELQRDKNLAPPTLHPTRPAACLLGQSNVLAQGAGWQTSKNLPDQPQRLKHFIKAHDHSGCNIAIAVRGHLDLQYVIRRSRMITAQVPRLCTGPPGQTGQAQLCSQRRRDPPGGHEAILQTSMLFVD